MSSLTSFLLLVPSLIKEHPSVKRHAQLIKVKSLCLRQEIILSSFTKYKGRISSNPSKFSLCNLDCILGTKKDKAYHSFLEDYEK